MRVGILKKFPSVRWQMRDNADSCKRLDDEAQKDKIMKEKILEILAKHCTGRNRRAADEILSLLDENTEGVSTGLQESCGLHDVSDSNASRSSEDVVSEPVVEGALEIITDTKEFDSVNLNPSGIPFKINISDELILSIERIK